MVAAAVQEGSDEGQAHVESAGVFCSEHAAYAVLGKETVEGLGVAGREEVDVEASGGG